LSAALASHYAVVQVKAKAKAKEDEEALLTAMKKQVADAALSTATLIV
jgi:branched-subunit amino acid aminotransferase/4-amino-4-deoxychorismate lyase